MTTDAAGTVARAGSRARWVLLAASLLLVAVPFLVVSFPPSTDLPQCVAQIRLLGEVLGGRAPELQVNWLGPGNAAYALVALAWLLLPPLEVGRAVLLVLALAWVGSAFWLAGRRGRPWEAAVLAAVLIFDSSLYWGFLPFLIGWPCFALWLQVTDRALASGAPAEAAARHPGRELAVLGAAALALYASHSLWFLAGVAWVGLLVLRRRPACPRLALLGLSLAPCLLAAAVWYPSLIAQRSSAGFDLAPHWFVLPHLRLDPRWLLAAALDRPPGSSAVLAGLAMLGWAAASLWSRRRELAKATDVMLLGAAALLLALALLVPDKHVNTILLAERWVPCGFALVLIGLPAPDLRPALLRLGVLGLLCTYSTTTAAAWSLHEQEELSGLRPALRVLPPAPRVLGLDFVKHSEHVPGRPFLQLAAYAQVLQGGELGFSFAEHSSGLVSYKQRRAKGWTPGLEWHAEQLRPADMTHFDHLLVNAAPALHERIAALPDVEPVTTAGRWRLYRLEPSLVPSGATLPGAGGATGGVGPAGR
ncbi:MAG: hypothetical protein FJ125_08325 [Deltaproteobacteria bacterium]|nr:hypothetical protein [Deltaproteobacteria bacterium]